MAEFSHINVDQQFSPQISHDNVTYQILAIFISDYHNSFIKLYPHASVIPKMHSMIHMPRLIPR